MRRTTPVLHHEDAVFMVSSLFLTSCTIQLEDCNKGGYAEYEIMLI
jgi:hypothetical protein